MSADTVLVTELTTTYSKGGMRYGPFKATAEKPYLEVPASIALASGAPVYDGEPIAAEQAELTGSVQLDDILKANHDLKADLDAMTQERDRLQGALNSSAEQLKKAGEVGLSLTQRASEWERIANEQGAEVTKLTDQLATAQARIAELDKVSDERDALKESLDTADEAGKHLQAERDTLQARVAELEAGNGQLLPAKDEAITRISSVKRVSDEMAAEIYTALTAPKSEAD